METLKKVPGLLQKYYLSDDNSKAVSGIYIFENKDARVAFWNSALAKAIPATYAVKVETLRVEEFEVSIEMMEMAAV